MADVTISNLPIGTPSGNVVIPYSDGSTTYTARPSAIVAASSGSVLQVVSQSNIIALNIGDGTDWQPFINISIIPKFTSSKILIDAGTVVHRTVGNSSDYYQINLVRNDNYDSQLTIVADAALYQSFGNGQREFYSTKYLDAPNTTNITTYRIVGKRLSGTPGVSYATFNMANAGYVTLTEIAA